MREGSRREQEKNRGRFQHTAIILVTPMKTITLFLRSALFLSIYLLAAAAANAAPVIFIVRHAEKATTGGGDDPDLSLAGQKRADALARILNDSQITALFVT